ncbi:AI-2E family transporter [Mesorhizobium sp. B3-1-1]|uniref:AI-2E family transporter n=1 Tax=unclassified Mesorhizobium TaxID=325217 RepID=UPI0032B2721F
MNIGLGAEQASGPISELSVTSSSRPGTDYTMAKRTLFAPTYILAVIAVIWALQAAASIFAPVVCALFLIALVWPLQRSLQRLLPKLIALAIVVCVVVLAFFAFASIASWGFGRIGRSVLADSARFQGLYSQLAEWLEGHGVVMAGAWAEHFNVGWFVRIAQGVTARLNTVISFWIVVVVYVLLGLLDAEAAARNARVALSAQAAAALINGSSQTASKWRRYMLVRTLMRLATGSMVCALSAAFGLRFAAEWGVIAFTLNYIPFIGPFVATFLPTLYALAQFGSPQAAVSIFAGLNIIQFVIGSYIEPRVAGYVLAMSPFVVLFSVFFWSFLWGVFGAFIGVPITIALVTFCSQSPATLWIAQLLGSADRRNA